MHSLTIPYPEDLLVTSSMSASDLEDELRFLLAVKLFELHRLTLGKAARFCEMTKPRFMFELGRLKIPVINLQADQMADELRK